jgi:DNA-directed RNA polymerase subunit L
MDPNIQITATDNVLTFTASECHVSLANALRRTITSDISTVVFKVEEQHNKEEYDFMVNTTRFNNEFLKQRLSCIPIHITDLNTPIRQLQVEVDETNTGNTIKNITTEHFKIKNIESDTYLDHSEVAKIFPPDKQTGDYILFCKLKQKISNEIPGEQVKFTARMSIGTARESGTYNVSSTCAYACTPDKDRQIIEWAKIKDTLQSADVNIAIEERNWLLLDGKRVVLPDSFDFKIESVGVFKNIEIVKKGCEILLDNIRHTSRAIIQKDIAIKISETTMENSFDVILSNETTTLGKILEYIGYKMFYEGSKTISFICYKKIHPHNDDSILRITFNEEIDIDIVRSFIEKICDTAFSVVKKIYEQFPSA